MNFLTGTGYETAIAGGVAEVLSQESPWRLTQRMAGTRVALTEDGAMCPHAQDVDGGDL
jgi:hypothetical protein